MIEYNENEILEDLEEQSDISIKNVENFYAYKDRYDFDIYLQRGIVWDNYTKSELIVSLLTKNPIPLMVVNIREGKHRFLDGKNRSNAIIGFVNNEYSLSNRIKILKLRVKIGEEKKIYDLRGKYFKDFDTELQQYFMARLLKIEVFQDLTDTQEAEIIKRQNSGIAMSGIAKARLQSFDDLLPIVTQVKESSLFQRKANIPRSLREKYKLDEKIIYSIIATMCGVHVTDDIEVMVENIRKDSLFTTDIKEEMKYILEYMDTVFPKKTSFLNSSNFLPIFCICKKYMGKVTPRTMYSYLFNLKLEENKEYTSIKGNWNSQSCIDKKTMWISKYIENVYLADN